MAASASEPRGARAVGWICRRTPPRLRLAARLPCAVPPSGLANFRLNAVPGYLQRDPTTASPADLRSGAVPASELVLGRLHPQRLRRLSRKTSRRCGRNYKRGGSTHDQCGSLPARRLTRTASLRPGGRSEDQARLCSAEVASLIEPGDFCGNFRGRRLNPQV